MLLIVAVIGILLLAGLVIAIIAASVIDADSFEFVTTISKVASISIKIRSRRERTQGQLSCGMIFKRSDELG
jgi:hypothetical protein